MIFNNVISFALQLLIYCYSNVDQTLIERVLKIIQNSFERQRSALNLKF